MSLALGGCDLVADALGGDLALELGERQQHVEGQSSHAGRGVERLGDRDEAMPPLPSKLLDQLGEVGERARQPVDLVDDDLIDLACVDIVEQALECRPFQRPARQAAIVVGFDQKYPAFVLLAGDIGGAGLALGVEGIEVLLETLFRAFPRVDRAANSGHDRYLPTAKNRGPDQRAPVISRATADSDRNRRPFQRKPSVSTSTSWVRPFHSRINRAPGCIWPDGRLVLPPAAIA